MKKGGYPKIDRMRNNPEIIRVTNFLGDLGVRLEIKASEDDWLKLTEYFTGIEFQYAFKIDPKTITSEQIENRNEYRNKVEQIHKKLKALLYEGIRESFVDPVYSFAADNPSELNKSIIKYLKIEAALIYEYFKALKNDPSIIPEKFIPDFVLKNHNEKIDNIAYTSHIMQSVLVLLPIPSFITVLYPHTSLCSR